MADEKDVGTEIKAFESSQGATGTIRFLESLDEVLECFPRASEGT